MKRAFLFLLTYFCAHMAFAQNAQIAGFVRDMSHSTVPKAIVTVVSRDTAVKRSAVTNDDGLYTIPALPPGNYWMTVEAAGFGTQQREGITLAVEQIARIDFTLQVGSTEQTVTVEANASLVNSTDPVVATTVDHTYIEQLPLNGRSFDSLVSLTPGLVLTSANSEAQGHFSVNGQRADANYFTVDGVSANIGITTTRFGVGGTVPQFTVTGGSSNLASVEAVEQFKVLTSSFAPEYGRKPGAQVVVTTRSGSNQYHGVLFEYFRNDFLDANDWFSNSLGLPRPALRQNDFGGTFGGPIWKNHTFFFVSYEGFRVREPSVSTTEVPNAYALSVAAPSVRPFLALYPRANGPNVDTIDAQFNAAYSNPTTADNGSLRLDHYFSEKVNAFARYNLAPSDKPARSVDYYEPPNVTYDQSLRTTTFTAGVNWLTSPSLVSQARFNYSRSSAHSAYSTDNFGGATPYSPSLIPGPDPNADAVIAYGSSYEELFSGPEYSNRQTQFEAGDSISWNKGKHQIKAGGDLRRTESFIGSFTYQPFVIIDSLAAIQGGFADEVDIDARRPPNIIFWTNSFFAQDTWRVNPRLTLTYGLRWDVNPAFTVDSPYKPLAILPYSNYSQLAPAPAGTSIYKTPWHDLGPRIGVAYQLRRAPGRELVFRGGWGIFYDSGSAGTLGISGYPPYLSEATYLNVPLPLAPSILQPVPLGLSFPETQLVQAENPNIRSPKTYEWNIALEQALGANQKVTVTWVGAAGRDLQQEQYLSNPSVNFSSLYLNQNTATSSYNALQAQFERRLAHGLQVLGSYSWSHSLDDASTQISFYLPLKGSSDYDIRHAATIAAVYMIPTPRAATPLRAVLGGWSLNGLFTAHSGMPVDVSAGVRSYLANGQELLVRPIRVLGTPLYLDDPHAPGGRRINPAAFSIPPAGQEGNLGRNALRGFGMGQLDFSLHRTFALAERLHLEFRGEMFNITNHPNFGPPNSSLSYGSLFGVPTKMLGSSLASSPSGVSPLYQVGGPRSIQLGARFVF